MKRGRRPTKNVNHPDTRQTFLGEMWWTNTFLEVLEKNCDEDILNQGRLIAKERRVKELEISKGRVRASIESEEGSLDLLINWPQFSKYEWDSIIKALSFEPLLYERLLNNDLPRELSKIGLNLQVNLIPNGLEGFSFAYFEKPGDAHLITQGKMDRKRIFIENETDNWSPSPNPEAVAAYLSLSERITTDPFLLFLLRGMGRDEITSSVQSQLLPNLLSEISQPLNISPDLKIRDTEKKTHIRSRDEISQKMQETDLDIKEDESSLMFYSPRGGLDSVQFSFPDKSGRETRTFRLLGPSPFEIDSTDLAEFISEIYPKAAAFARRYDPLNKLRSRKDET